MPRFLHNIQNTHKPLLLLAAAAAALAVGFILEMSLFFLYIWLLLSPVAAATAAAAAAAAATAAADNDINDSSTCLSLVCAFYYYACTYWSYSLRRTSPSLFPFFYLQNTPPPSLTIDTSHLTQIFNKHSPQNKDLPISLLPHC